MLEYRQAGVLDVPYVFDLMLEGAVQGAFSDTYVKRNGCVKLLYMVLRQLLSQSFRPRSWPAASRWEIVMMAGGYEAGFIKVSRAEQDVWVLELLSINPQVRGIGIGKTMVRRLLDSLPQGAKLVVHCTKYAKGMRSILRHEKFVQTRSPNIPPDLDEFVKTVR